jgi:hypothetical protein
MACGEGSQGTASRAPGCVGGASTAVPPRLTLKNQALRAMHEDRLLPASSRPRPGRRSGVNRKRLNITAPYAKLPAPRSQARLLATASRPAGSRKGRLCLAPRPDEARRPLSRTALEEPTSAATAAPSPQSSIQAARRKVEWSPRPPRVVCCAGPQRCALLAPCSQPPHPSAPASGGSPKFNGNPGAVSPSLTLQRRPARVDFARAVMRCKA